MQLYYGLVRHIWKTYYYALNYLLREFHGSELQKNVSVTFLSQALGLSQDLLFPAKRHSTSLCFFVPIIISNSWKFSDWQKWPTCIAATLLRFKHLWLLSLKLNQSIIYSLIFLPLLQNWRQGFSLLSFLFSKILFKRRLKYSIPFFPISGQKKCSFRKSLKLRKICTLLL